MSYITSVWHVVGLCKNCMQIILFNIAVITLSINVLAFYHECCSLNGYAILTISIACGITYLCIIREFKQTHFWAMDGKEKLNFFLFGAFLCYRVCNVKPQSSTRAFPFHGLGAKPCQKRKHLTSSCHPWLTNICVFSSLLLNEDVNLSCC